MMKLKLKRKAVIFIILIIVTIALVLFFSLSSKFGCMANKFDISVLFGQPCQTASPYYICDLNRDKECNEMDKKIFDSAFGSCRGQSSYNFNADIDGDGCIVSADKESFTASQEIK